MRTAPSTFPDDCCFTGQRRPSRFRCRSFIVRCELRAATAAKGQGQIKRNGSLQVPLTGVDDSGCQNGTSSIRTNPATIHFMDYLFRSFFFGNHLGKFHVLRAAVKLRMRQSVHLSYSYKSSQCVSPSVNPLHVVGIEINVTLGFLA